MRHLILFISLYCLISASPLAHASIKGISIVGERHSGTNFVRDLLRATLDHQPDNFFVDERICGRTASLETNRQRFKHRFQFPDFNTCNLTEQLIIVMLRNPFDWSLSMKKHCWCTNRGPGHGRNPFEDTPITSFATSPWIPNDLYSPIPPVNKSYPKTRFLGHDRIPGFHPYDNLLHMRACKLKNHLDIQLWAPNVVYLNQEDTLESGDMWKWLRGLVLNYSLPRRTSYSEPAINRVFKLSSTEPHEERSKATVIDPLAITSLNKVWDYIDNPLSTILVGVKISYLGSMKGSHSRLEYDPSAAKLKSLWFNPDVITSKDPDLRQHTRNVNRLMYQEIEARAGYHPLAIKGSTGTSPSTTEGAIKCGW